MTLTQKYKKNSPDLISCTNCSCSCFTEILNPEKIGFQIVNVCSVDSKELCSNYSLWEFDEVTMKERWEQEK